MFMKSIYDFDLAEMTKLMEDNGFKKFNATQVFQWLYRQKVTSFDEMTNLSIKLRDWLKENYSIERLEVLRLQVSRDGTRKYLHR